LNNPLHNKAHLMRGIAINRTTLASTRPGTGRQAIPKQSSLRKDILGPSYLSQKTLAQLEKSPTQSKKAKRGTEVYDIHQNLPFIINF